MDAEFMTGLIDAYGSLLIEEIRCMAVVIQLGGEEKVANADGKIIPLTEDDQGEGVKDPLTVDDLIKAGFYDQQHEHQADLFKRLIQNQFNAPKKIKIGENPPRYEWEPDPFFDGIDED